MKDFHFIQTNVFRLNAKLQIERERSISEISGLDDDIYERQNIPKKTKIFSKQNHQENEESSNYFENLEVIIYLIFNELQFINKIKKRVILRKKIKMLK